MNYFIAVNYGTSDLIDAWAQSCRKASNGMPSVLYLVDNFKSDEERKLAQTACNDHAVNLIENRNTGYGSALNYALDSVVHEAPLAATDLIIAGNLDLEIKHIRGDVHSAPSAYMAEVKQNGKSKNPYIKNVQRPLLPLYGLVYHSRSPILFKAVAGFIKLFKALPSKPYTCHGSLFVLNGAFLKELDGPIFNPDSFLYVEELEFGEYLKSHKIELRPIDIVAEHVGRVSTAAVTTTLHDSIRLWAPSWKNWRQRWG